MKDYLRDKTRDLLRPGYYFCKDIVDLKGRKRLKKNISINNLYSGKRAFLLLTGASLQQVDIKKLKDEYTLGVSLIFLHEDIEKIGLSFYVSLGTDKILRPGLPLWPTSCSGQAPRPLGPEGILEVYRELDTRLGNETNLILHSDSYKLIKKHNVFQHKTVHYTKGKKRLHVPQNVPYEVIADLTKRSISGGGSVFFSILILMYMGFKEIYLCGAGYTYEPTYQFHFYDSFVFPRSMGRDRAEIEARKAISKRGSRAEYYGLFEKDNLYRCICVVRRGYGYYRDKHRMVDEYARSQGVNIYNIVPDGFESPIYERMSWEEVENNILSGKPG